MILKETLVRRIHSSACIIFVLMSGVFLPLSAHGSEKNKAEVEKSSDTSARKTEQSDAIQNLIREIERNEKLYANLKITFTSDYEKLPKPVDLNKQIQSKTQTSIDLQGQKYRIQTQATGRFELAFRSLPKKPVNHSISGTHERVETFDGNTHRGIWKSNKTSIVKGGPQRITSDGQISDEPTSLTNLVRPHMFLLDGGCPKVPLSTYLKGTKAVLAHPNPSYVSKNSVTDVKILGDAKFQGLRCTKIQIETTLGNGNIHSKWELWLTRDRNLIPVRKFAYTYRWSKELPIAESTVDEWQEVRPGVWFPRKAHTDRYDSRIAKREGKQKLSWKKHHDVKSIVLDPQIKPEVFTKLDFPPGTSVSIVKDGKRIQEKDEDTRDQ